MIPPNVKTSLQARAHSLHGANMQQSRENITSATGLLKHIAVRMVDEPSPQQARAIDKILRLPK